MNGVFNPVFPCVLCCTSNVPEAFNVQHLMGVHGVIVDHGGDFRIGLERRDDGDKIEAGFLAEGAVVSIETHTRIARRFCCQ